jgi:GT2 family glycosyltransferase
MAAAPHPWGAPDLAVIIPTRRRAEILRRTLAALKSQTVTGFETIVVFDGRDQEVFDPDGGRVLVKDGAGPGAARNAGVRATDRPLVLFLGDDMIPESELVERHLECHRDQPGVTVGVLGHVDWHHEVSRGRVARWMDWSSTQFDYRNITGQEAGFGRFYSCNVSLKRELFAAAEGFDEEFVFYYEDLDLGWRLGQLGLRLLYEPRARAQHLHGYDDDTLSRRFEGIARGERMMAEKHSWFTPFFAGRVREAQSQRRASPLWARIVDKIPEGHGGLRRLAERRANAWYHQRVASRFMGAWESAGAGDDQEATSSRAREAACGLRLCRTSDVGQR